LVYPYYKLKLYKPQHEVIWQIEALDELIDDCEKLLETVDNQVIRDRVLGLYKEYRKYTKQLGAI